MKFTFFLVLASFVSVATAAPDEKACERLLKATSDKEALARKAYLLSSPSQALSSMEHAASEFENYAMQCSLERPLSYVGVLVHGRLSIVYRKLGKQKKSDQSANLAIKYGSIRAKREVSWSDVELVIANADTSQRESLK
jgi:hypothetical protein